jgi:hypothetical protein
MTFDRTILRRVALALGALGLIVTAVAAATHVRPKGATPLRASLVPAFKQCTAPNRTHGAPLAFPSCAPPVQTSNYLTVGTPDANGAAANSIGHLVITIAPHDVLASGTITDVRCKPGTSASVCGSANAQDGPDYSGELQSNATIRISDHYSGPNHDEAATVQDIPFPLNWYCASTADTSVGGTCTGMSYDPTPYPRWYEGTRAVVEIGQLEVFDGGPDGQVSTNDNTVFMRQGVFIP